MHTPATIGGKKRSLFVCNVPLNGEVPITRPIEDMTPSLLQFWNPHTLGTQEMQKKKIPTISPATNSPLKWSFLPFFD